MSGDERVERPDEDRGEPQGAGAPAEAEEAERDERGERARAYRFRIAPADPKNALNFEDVADK